ncbi:S1 family peptidase [Streptomyces flavofungini]|uniref:S1 family peptidase n=1 Tax=Streptomyces flavofungini TaxID=68200 RepID=A0ABS0XDU3_9ACTN|nr:S1 family peptidase [Streptomyces flavofungini]MBJ3811370.1 S1 family peptidase [Streptomyces flavofungini]GHC42776.1 serine protease [Streptomyces flavofungini]
MNTQRASRRRLTITGVGVAALVAGTLTMANTSAAAPAPTPDTLTATAAGKLANSLSTDLKSDLAGAHYDATAKKLVVSVLDSAAADQARASGAEARLVKNSRAELNSVQKSLGERAVPGTSRAVDPVANKVVVTADSTVKGAALNRLRAEVAAQDGKAVLKRTAGKFQPLIRGGDAIYASSGRCSLGFNVVKNGQPYFLTAGHCAALAGTTWSETQGGSAIGTVEDYGFPGRDDAIVKYTASTAHPSEVNLYNGSAQQITGARTAVVGEQVQRSGSTTKLHGGSVQALNVSVTYPQGTVNGLIQTNVCAEPGDSGGAMFAGNSALGLTSGGSGNCSSGGQTFFAPVTDALSRYGAQIG